MTGKRIDKIAFAATKADQLHHHQHDRLADLTEAIVSRAIKNARYNGADISTKAIASIRATIEESREHRGQTLDLVRGMAAGERRAVSFHYGDLPADPQSFLARAHTLESWPEDGDFALMRLDPPDLSTRQRGGIPHIRLDQLTDFLIGDRL